MRRRISRKSLLAAGTAAVLILIAAAGYRPALDKAEDLRYRFQLLERRVASLGEIQAAPLIRHQMERGDARFDILTEPPRAAGHWQQIGGSGIAGSWRSGHFLKAKAMTVGADDLFVGLLAPTAGEAEIWKFDGEAWTRIADAGLIPEWRGATYVQALIAVEGGLIAAVDNSVWRFADGVWTELADPDGGRPWPAGAVAYSLAVLYGAPVVGLTGGAARVFRFGPGGWREMSEGLPESLADGVYDLRVHDDSKMYAGVISVAGPGLVYRRDGDHWSLVGGAGVQGSWLSDGSTYPLSLAGYQGSLIVTLNRNPQVAGAFVSVWALQGDEWHPVGARSAPAIWAETDNFNASLAYRGLLYVGGGGRPAGNAGVWEYAPGQGWSQIGGHGIRGSWSPRRSRMSGSRHATAEYVYRLVEWRGQLVAGFGDAPGAAQVWAYTPGAQ